MNVERVYQDLRDLPPKERSERLAKVDTDDATRVALEKRFAAYDREPARAARLRDRRVDEALAASGHMPRELIDPPESGSSEKDKRVEELLQRWHGGAAR